MFCYQCQEAMKNSGCDQKVGMCGKTAEVANLQDLLMFALKGLAACDRRAAARGLARDPGLGRFVLESLFMTITNANFDGARFERRIGEALALRDALRARLGAGGGDGLPDAATWAPAGPGDYAGKAKTVGVLATANEDVRSLRALLTYGIKGIGAYGEHAGVLGAASEAVVDFVMKGLAATVDDGLSADDLVGLVMECGKTGVEVMALLDKANTDAYGHPEPTQVRIGVRGNPGILISGHDLKDLEELLVQTEGTGVDVYTHSEMLPANSYPAFKKFKHFAGNYGNAWWRQKEEFESFRGPVLFTTNCIVPPKDSYKDRLFTTGCAGYPGATHIPDRVEGRPKDFSAVIAMAKTCPPPKEIESGTVWGGFARNAVMSVAPLVVGAVKSGAIKRFVVMAGCDGRHKEREYYAKVAEKLPKDTVILTAGCAKYRYNKLPLGTIGGIPRVIDAGQCNDSYSLAYIALQLKDAFGLKDINDLPISYDVAWYEQKAVIVLLALLYLGVKGIRLGPTLPAFLSPGVAKVLVEKFAIRPIGEPEADVAAMLAGS